MKAQIKYLINTKENLTTPSKIKIYCKAKMSKI